MREELILGVDKEKAYFSLSDIEGKIGDTRLDYVEPKLREIFPPETLLDHKMVRIKYNLYPNAKKAENPKTYKDFLKKPQDYQEPQTLGEINRQAQITCKLDLTNLIDFVNGIGAEKRMSITGAPEGEFGQFWVLNLRILNPSQVQLFK